MTHGVDRDRYTHRLSIEFGGRRQPPHQSRLKSSTPTHSTRLLQMETTEAIATRALGDDQLVYLRPDIKVEPLLFGWHAWPHLIAPLQHGLNIINRHTAIMRSFIMNPSVHLAAVSNPAMSGGPFIGLPASQTSAVRDLLDATTRDCRELIDVANAYLEFDRGLQSSATGFSLEEHYDSIPAPLKGLVELFYDVNSHPKIRFFEQLLWDLRLNIHGQQLYIGPMADDERKFFMSNPRISADHGIIRTIPFSDPAIDAIAAARCEGASYRDVKTVLAADTAGSINPEPFLTLEPPEQTLRSVSEAPSSVRVRYFGHACVFIETADTSVLLDPVLAWEDHPDGRYTYYDLPSRIDHIAISHGHHDHFYPESLLQLRWKTGRVVVPTSNTGSVADPSLKLILRQLGFQDVVALDPFDEVKIPGGRIISLPFPGEHADLDIYTKQSLCVEVEGRRLLFLVDSNALDLALYTRLAERLGPIDMLFLGMECHGAPLNWLYGPLLSQPITRKNDESRRLSASKAERAWQVVSELNPAKVFLYAMGQEPFLAHLTGLAYNEDSIQLREAGKFVALCQENGVNVRHLNGSQELHF